jgi:hypothetical protein
MEIAARTMLSGRPSMMYQWGGSRNRLERDPEEGDDVTSSFSFVVMKKKKILTTTFPGMLESVHSMMIFPWKSPK